MGMGDLCGMVDDDDGGEATVLSLRASDISCRTGFY